MRCSRLKSRGPRLNTLAKRGLVEIVEEPAEFTVSVLKARPSLFDSQFSPAQQAALKSIQQSVNARKFAGMLLHGVTGSGKTAIYLSAMRAVLEAGRSAILLVPEIGLTPAVAADLHQLFGDESCHPALGAFRQRAGRAVASHQARRRRAWWWARVRRCSLRSPIWRW